MHSKTLHCNNQCINKFATKQIAIKNQNVWLSVRLSNDDFSCLVFCDNNFE